MDKDNNIQAEVLQLACEVIHVVNTEHAILISEIKRIKKILGEASSDLTNSFNSMYREFNDKIETGNNTDKNTGAQHLNSGIKALQFEDIVQQILDHTKHRIESIEKMYSFLQNCIQHCENNKYDAVKLNEVISDCHMEIEKTRKLLELENPAKQESLDKGDSVLF